MAKRPNRVIALSALALALGAGAAEPWPDAESVLAQQPSEVVTRLLERKIVVTKDVQEGGDQAFVVAYVIFGKPRSEVLDLLTQSSRQIEYRPELRRIEMVQDDARGRIDEHELKIMFRKIVYRLRYLRDPSTDRIEWNLDPSFDNDLRRLDGFWELYAFEDERTLGYFGSVVDVGRALPRFVQDGMTRRTVLRTVENCRKWIDSGGQWRP